MRTRIQTICNALSHSTLRPRSLTIHPAPQILQQRFASILGSLSDNLSAYNKKIRRGRGPGSGKGKTSGRGHKGQKARGKVPFGFEGGQKPLEIVHGKRGFENPFSEDLATVNLDRLQSWIDQGRINPSKPITFVELLKSNCISSVRDGVKLLARGTSVFKTPVHLYVSRASSSAIAAIESQGGSVTTRFYSKFAIRNILRGKIHPIHSRLFKPTPITKLAVEENKKFEYALPDPVSRKDLEYYRDIRKRGYLSYQVPPGHTPSLYYRNPGVGTDDSSKMQKSETNSEKNQGNLLW